MSHIEKTIARLPGMNAKALATLRGNAYAVLAKNPGDADARKIVAALDALEAAKPKATAFEVTGLLSWQKHRHGEGTFLAFHGENAVGRIFKRADHTSLDKEVYSVEILGEAIAGSFHHIRDARAAGERAFASNLRERCCGAARDFQHSLQAPNLMRVTAKFQPEESAPRDDSGRCFVTIGPLYRRPDGEFSHGARYAFHGHR